MVNNLSTSHASILLIHFQLAKALEILAHQLSCMEIIETSQAKRLIYQQGVAENHKKLRRIPPVRGRIKRRIFAKFYKCLKHGTSRVITSSFCRFNLMHANATNT